MDFNHIDKIPRVVPDWILGTAAQPRWHIKLTLTAWAKWDVKSMTMYWLVCFSNNSMRKFLKIIFSRRK